jgi:Recombination endonuclease VII
MTPEQKLDKYYQKKFGWTLAEVDALFASQGNVCAACKRPPGERRLSLDHDHAFDRLKIDIVREIDDQYWVVSCIPYVEPYGGYATKKEAREFMRRKLRRLSVRAGLCLRCNKGLQMFEDSKAPLPPSERLIRLARILENFKVCPPIRSLSEQPAQEKS